MPCPASVNRSLLLSAFIAAAVAALPAQAQAPSPGQAASPAQPAPQLAPPKAYKPVPVTLPKPYDDPSFAAFRKELGEIAGKKDRTALAKLIVNNFFWLGEKGDKTDKQKSSIDNLAAAIELDDKDGAGWEALKFAANEPTLESAPGRTGIMCSPANPAFDEAAAENVAKETGTDASEWGFIVKPEAEVRSAAKGDAPVIEKLGQILVRIMLEQPATTAAAPAAAPPFLRVVTPSGKVGYVAEEFISPLGTDQLCYVKDGTAWKIAGYAAND